MRKTIALILMTVFFSAVNMPAEAQDNLISIENPNWRIWCGEKRIESIVNLHDTLSPVFPGRNYGDVLVSYKVEGGMWQKISAERREMSYDEASGCVTYTDKGIGNAIVMSQKFSLDGEEVIWEIELRNNTRFPILLGDVAPAFPWNKPYSKSEFTPTPDEPEVIEEETFERRFTKHHFIKGNTSFIYYTRFGGQAPYYIWTADSDTHMEYWAYDNRTYRAYIHSGKSGEEQTRGTWRNKHTFGKLQPAGQEGDHVRYSFRFNDAGSYDEMREIIYANKLMDIHVLPAMTIPKGQYGYFALHTQSAIDSVTAEFPEKTCIEPLGMMKEDIYGYRVQFDRLGENQLTIHYDGDRKTYLEYFSILSPETMMKERARFLVETQQIRQPGKWFDGLYGPYDMKNGKLLTPEEPDIYDRVRTYFIASDDPALGKAPFIASKNEVFPDDAEIASLEYHIKNFVWGGLQRTDKEEPYPYGIYGTPNYNINRNPELKATQSDFRPEVMRAWRSFDYPHVIMLYWHMYRIATLYPEKCTYLDADGYLERAYQTAKAYFLYPTELHGDYYETFKWGCYNELLIPELINELEIKGQDEKADLLRGYWERKAKYFIYDDPYPYHSEYEMDRTAFESSFALAEYALKNPMESDDSLWYDNNFKVWYSHPDVNDKATWDFMDRQFYANLSCRGVLEAEWNTLGSDFFGSSDHSEHSYMARMGGYGVLNYALKYDEDPTDWLSLGYASYLDPYGVMNVGDEESGYGYWYPGKEKNGAIGQAYTSEKFGKPWIGTEEDRGPWRFCGEGDLGMCAITRTATSVLVNDPIFGWVYYGGRMNAAGDKQFELYPDDGVRQDMWIISGGSKVHIKLERDNWSTEKPVTVDLSSGKAVFTIANGTSDSHSTRVLVETAGCRSTLSAEGKRLKASGLKGTASIYTIPISSNEARFELKWR